MDVTGMVAGFLVLLGLTGVAHPVAERIRLPVVVVLAAFGVMLAMLVRFGAQVSPMLQPLHDVVSAHPVSSDVLFHTLLPILLFQGALSMDVRHLLRDGVAVLVMAIVAVLVSVGVIAAGLFFITGLDWMICVLLGSIVATTDPSAVIAVFRSLGAPPRLTRLVEGESLLNDATAIAVFSLVLGSLTVQSDVTILALASQLSVGFIVGLAFGVVSGVVIAWGIGPFREQPVLQITLALTAPFAVFLSGEYIPGASPVIAVVAAGVAMGMVTRSRMARDTHEFFEKMVNQLSEWATGLIIFLAALVIPFSIERLSWVDAMFVLVVAVSALFARALVLWGLVPFLAHMGVMRKVEKRMNLALLWGGLRGAMTLALALVVVESGLPDDVSRFILITATGYTLFTLFVQGTTLQALMRVLKLDVLPPAEQAFRDQTLKEALRQAKERTLRFGQRIGVRSEEDSQVLAAHEARLEELVSHTAYEALPDMEKLRLGLAALVAHEHHLLSQQGATLVLRPGLMDTYLFNLDKMRDAARLQGRTGYMSVARGPLKGSFWEPAHIWMHNNLRFHGPLARHVAERYHAIVVMRILVLQVLWHARSRLKPIFGERIVGILVEILERRLEEITKHLDDLRVQYPGFAKELEDSLLAAHALREERDEVNALEKEGLVDPQVARSLRQEGDWLSSRLARPSQVDVRKPRPELLRALPPFAQFSDSQLKRLARQMRAFHARPGKSIYRPNDAITHIYFISSGAVEVRRGDCVTKLGPGQAFGQLRILNPELISAEVVTLSHCDFFRLPVSKFREFLREMPSWKGEMRRHGAWIEGNAKE